jgi:hypothetical protein
MQRINRTLQLARASWEVLKADKELTILPVLSFLASAVVTATFIAPMFLIGDDPGVLGYLLMFLLYVVLAYITIFFNTALVGAANERLQGGDPTLGSALRAAAELAGRILPWAVVSATVSILLRTIEERGGFLGQIVASIAGIAWGLVTYLVIPIFVVEGKTVGMAIKRSGELFKRTWGENVAAQFGFGILGFLLILPAVLLIFLGVAAGSGAVVGIAVLAAVLWGVAVSVVMAALSAIFQTALYHYAAENTVLGPFGRGTIATAFGRK